jgi:hypothetical protein
MSSELIDRLNEVLPSNAKAVPFHWGHLHLMELDTDQQLTMEHIPNYAQIIQHYANTGPSCTILVDGRPGLSFGTISHWQGLYEMWLIVDQPTAKKYPIALTKNSRKAVEITEELVKPVRLQLVVRRDNFSACKWARAIGFDEEATVRRYTPDGRDCTFYVRIQ